MLEQPFKAVPTDGEKPPTPEGLTEKERSQAEALTRCLEVTTRLLRDTAKDKNPDPKALEAIREIIGNTQTTDQLENLLRALMEAEELKEPPSEKPDMEKLKQQAEERAETRKNLKGILEGNISHESK
ncbi:hypothetical protein CL629_03120 [bacterium]|nr:hypothetical protein [bacterium]|tara:strand:+ start:2553 stop:2936 length:384 start_codon:yes stop_codon:yes gene_type:complete